jgi:hypothetical protein
VSLLLFILSNFYAIKLIEYYKEYPFDAVVEGNNKTLFRICVVPGREHF